MNGKNDFASSSRLTADIFQRNVSLLISLESAAFRGLPLVPIPIVSINHIRCLYISQGVKRLGIRDFRVPVRIDLEYAPVPGAWRIIPLGVDGFWVQAGFVFSNAQCVFCALSKDTGNNGLNTLTFTGRRS